MIDLLKTVTRIHTMLYSMQRVVLEYVAAILKRIGVPARCLRWGLAAKYFNRLKSQKVLRTWYFAFSRDGQGRVSWWLDLFMKGQFTHVLAFSAIDNHVLVVNPIQSNIEFVLNFNPAGCHLPMPVEVIALDFALHGHEVVKIDYAIDKEPTSHALTNFFPGCVTIAKGILGISDWIFTPWQFHQWLLDHGGELFTKDKQDAVLFERVGCHLSDLEDGNVFKSMRGKWAMSKNNTGTADQQARLQAEEAQANADAAATEAKNARQVAMLQNGLLGRTSLIGTSELGVTNKLGS